MEIVALLRDLIIIIFGIIWIVAGVLVAAVAWLAWRFAKSLPRRAEAVTVPAQELFGQAKQAVNTAGEGAHTAKEAIGFVADKAVGPVIVGASTASAVRRFFEALISAPGRGRRRDAP
jgi:uncharacterized SAM-binding protein YcdF (DUF218 family)